MCAGNEMQLYISLLSRLAPPYAREGLFTGPNQRDLARTRGIAVIGNYPVEQGVIVLAEGVCRGNKRQDAWIDAAKCPEIFQLPLAQHVFIHVPQTEKAFQLLLLAQPEQLTSAANHTARQRMVHGRIGRHYQNQEIDPLSRRMQLPGHLVSYKPSVAKAA